MSFLFTIHSAGVDWECIAPQLVYVKLLLIYIVGLPFVYVDS